MIRTLAEVGRGENQFLYNSSQAFLMVEVPNAEVFFKITVVTLNINFTMDDLVVEVISL